MTSPAPASAPDTLDHEATTAVLDSGHVLRWWQSTAFLEVAGPDAATFLDGLCTQAVERIEPRCARLGLFLDAKAKIIAPVVLHRLDDAHWTGPRGADVVDAAPRFAIETLGECVEPLRSHLTRYRLRARATVEPSELATVALVGGGERDETPDEVPGGTWTFVEQPGRRTVALVGTRDACTKVVAAFGDVAADPDALEADRIAAGIASLHDLVSGRMPAEVGGMDAAVALDAGCYLGQEPVARLHYRGHANRTLRRLESEPGATIAPSGEDPDAALALRRPDAEPEARPVGRLTTWARRADGATVALAVLRRELARDDEVVLGDVAMRLRVVDDAPA